MALAWPVRFLSLGWNFLEYWVRNPFGEGVELGWLIPGIIFVVMGGVPSLAWFAARGHGPVVPGVRSTTPPIELNELASAMSQVSLRAHPAGRCCWSWWPVRFLSASGRGGGGGRTTPVMHGSDSRPRESPPPAARVARQGSRPSPGRAGPR